MATLLESAVAAHRAGRLPEAAKLYGQVLAKDPDHVEALQLLGMVAHRLGHTEDGLKLLDRAVRLDPEHGPALSNRGILLRSLGRLDEAIAAQRQALRFIPTSVESIAELVRLHHAKGEFDERERLISQLIAKHADRVEGWRFRAAFALEEGRWAEAAAALAEALRRRPGDPALLTDLAFALQKLGNLSQAEAVAGTGKPHPALLHRWGEILLEKGEVPAAIEKWRRALELDPAGAEAALSLGRELRNLGQGRASVEVFQAAVNANPEIPELWLGFGNSLSVEERHSEAENAWLRAVALRPNYVEALHNLGAYRVRSTDPSGGLDLLAQAVLASSESWPCVAFVDAVHVHDVGDTRLDDAIARCLACEGVDHQLLERALRVRIAQDPDVAPLLQEVERQQPVQGKALEVLARQRWLSPLLRSMIVRHPVWEELLRQLRRELLREVVHGEGSDIALLKAFAFHGWHTEYAWSRTEEERVTCAMLAASLADRLPREPYSLELAVELCAVAMYVPLDEMEGIHRRLAEPWREGVLGDLIHQQVVEGALEASLAASVLSLGPIEDAVSMAVRTQYEENPYPRLVSVHRKLPEPFAKVVRSLFPWLPPEDLPTAPKILIAGCGTGQQALAAATRYCGAQVTALDLSKRSLGAAMRHAARWDLCNLKFYHADLLALGEWKETFDLVEAGGVLHHLADPLAGWRVLKERTRAGGWMKIALYSELGRQSVIAAREFVSEHAFRATPAGLKQARKALLALPKDHPAASITYSPDFYSLSGLRDLVFHVQEHRFTLPQLARILAELDLEFIGFQHPRPEMARWYTDRFPGDLAMRDLRRWEEVELEHPETFAGMYQFWVRRK